jgi:hypothetical protein
MQPIVFGAMLAIWAGLRSCCAWRETIPLNVLHQVPVALVCLAGRMVVEGGDLHVAAQNGDLTDAKARRALQPSDPGQRHPPAGCVQRLLTGRVDVNGLDSAG